MRYASWLTFFALLLMPCASGASGQEQGKQDDEKKYTSAPEGFDRKRDGIERGKLETVEYDSTTVGVKRKAQVYTPPGYSKDQKYPGPVPPARHRRRRERVAARWFARRDPRQPVRRQEGGADDRRHAQRPGAKDVPGPNPFPSSLRRSPRSRRTCSPT